MEAKAVNLKSLEIYIGYSFIYKLPSADDLEPELRRVAIGSASQRPAAARSSITCTAPDAMAGTEPNASCPVHISFPRPRTGSARQPFFHRKEYLFINHDAHKSRP
jgi:hypothetical protein